jgi:arabinofuranosyltransferase
VSPVPATFAWARSLREHVTRAGPLVVIGLAAFVHAQRYHGAVIDDAFITFRYAWNLIHGSGFVYNPGERVEGTSSFLFTVVMAVPIGLGLEPYRVATTLASLAFAACAVLAYGAVRACIEDAGSRYLALAAAALVAASSQLAFHSQTGLETLLYAALVAAAFAAQLRALHLGQGGVTWARLLALAALTRPEGVAVFLWFWLAVSVWRWGRVRLALRELAAFSQIFGPVLVLRLLYFGHWLPNSVVAKSGHWETLALGLWRHPLATLQQSPGVQLLADYFSDRYVLLAALVGTLLIGRARYAGLLALGTVLPGAAAIVWNGGDWMPYGRLLTASVTPLLAAAMLGLRGVLFHEEQRARGRHSPSFAFSSLLIFFVAKASLARLDVKSVVYVRLQQMRFMGELMTPLARSGDVMATEYAGVLPYYWRVRVLDMRGLCDPVIARHGRTVDGGGGRANLAYVAAKRPTFYAFSTAREAADLYADPQFAEYRAEYNLVQVPYRLLLKTGVLPTLLVRKDRPDADAVARALGARLLDAGAELERTGFL